MSRSESHTTPSDYEIVHKALELFANEQKLMAFTSACDPKLHGEMIGHCANNGRANDALAALERIQHKLTMWEATHG